MSNLIEPLERRVLMSASSGGVPLAMGAMPVAGDAQQADLIGSITGLPTASLVAGVKGSATVHLTNVGSAVARGRITTDLFLSEDPALDAGDIELATLTRTLGFQAGKSHGLKFKFDYPPTGSGNYYLLARIDSTNAIGESNETNNVAQSNTVVELTPPFVNFTLAFSSTPANVHLGKGAATRVTVLNTGNVPYRGPLDISLYSATDSTGSAGAVTLRTISPRLSLQPNKPRPLKIHFSLPAGTARGTYYLSVAVDSSNKIAESEEADNFVVADTPFEAV